MRAAKESKRSKRSRFLRDAMVDVQIASRGIRNKRVLLSMRQIPREIFLERRFAEAAYEDGAVPIPKGQTLSQPYIVAKMLEAAAIAKSDRVLEIGAGSGYLAALAANLGREVCAVERHEALVQRARSRLRHLGCRNADLRRGRHRGMAGRGRVRRDRGVGRRRGDTRGSRDATSSLRTTDHSARQPRRRAAADEAGARARRPLRRGGDRGGAFRSSRFPLSD